MPRDRTITSMRKYENPVHSIDSFSPPPPFFSRLLYTLLSPIVILCQTLPILRAPFDYLLMISSHETEQTSAPRRLVRKTLILDLDETLVHSAPRSWSLRPFANIAGGFQTEVFVQGHAIIYYVAKRPHVTEWFNVIVFTASLPEYADPVISWLDPENKIFQGRYFRDSCTPHKNTFIKDISRVEPDLNKVMLVDNSAIAYNMHKENGIPVTSWLDDPDDEALLDLLPFLDGLRFVEDVRSILGLQLH